MGVTREGIVWACCAALMCGVLGCGNAQPAPASSGGSNAASADAGGGDVGGVDAGEDASAPDLTPGLPELHTWDQAAAARGEAVLLDWPIGEPLVPAVALRYLYITWGVGLPQMATYTRDADAYWAAFRARYGFHEAAWDQDGYPVGMHPSDGPGGGGFVSFGCLMCHADRVAGRVWVGTGNSVLDLQGLYDDLVALPAADEALKARDLPEPYGSLIETFPVPEVVEAPWSLEGRNQAAGAIDAHGIAFEFGQALLPGGQVDPPVETRFGFQTASSWWTMRHRLRRYWDGSGGAGAYRAMMSAMLAFDLSVAEYLALDATFQDIHAYVLSLEVPSWSESGFEAPEPEAVAEGRGVYLATCSGCHGVYEGFGRGYADVVVAAAEVGTDPIRTERFGPEEAAWVNRVIVGEGEDGFEATGGYLAPPLLGVWARAPYFHNGSVPTLEGVIAPSARPARWRRLGTDAAHYDPDAVGWRVEVVSEADAGDATTLEGRRVYDTTREGLSNAGHGYGAGLDAEARAALLAYLKTL